ncbi:hypothetical protein GCM10011519_24740 [Marmoricola endophyticus]|uniref:Methyltransferase n=1 Tax=Marmoricola endophyticus TaxID=2040280 RepID=A0A917F5X5_9ACTN|nr:class I SAM-dependent methyltransferase [Marmoricola endophyticus]GGF49822.1 hypothetical protein GCM10011519_24740 [Marmoricola endophyticus]
MSAPVEQQVEFGGLVIGYDHRVLAPREWTTAQSRWIAELSASSAPGPVLELCTGAGQIGLLAACETGRELVCVESSAAAAGHLRRNAERAGLDARVEVRQQDLSTALEEGETFPLVTADPPWVISSAVSRFPEDPLSAIDGGADGLTVARTCLSVIARHLAPQGAAVLQLGSRSQVESLGTMAEQLDLCVRETRSYDRGVLVLLEASA